MALQIVNIFKLLVYCRLFPNLQSSTFDGVLAYQLSLLNLTEVNIPKTVAFGKKYAVTLLKMRSDDGSQVFSNFVPAPPGGPPGKYEFTPGQTFALYPQLGTTKPFLISSGASFDTQGGPAALFSAKYNASLLEVMQYGKNNDSLRTQYQTDTAMFWADVPGTAGVAGHWFNITATLLPSTSSLYFISKVYAAVAVGQFDGSIAAWYQKYKYRNWRPVTAIRAGIDATWTPLLSTPGHPEYPSGHAATAAPSAFILAAFLGKNVTSVLPPFTIGTEYSGLAARTYTSLKDIVKEGADSRVFCGVHFRFSVESGEALGYKVGKKVFEKFSSIRY